MKKKLFAFAWTAATTMAAAAQGQTTTTYEDGPNGVRYQVTRQVVQRSIPTTEYQTRQQTVYRPQVATEYQTYQQNQIVPVTEYQYVPHLRNWWNPITGAYWTNDLQPVTRWVSRPATVQVPVARTNWVQETQTTQVPVTTYRTVADEHIYKQAMNVPAGAANIAASSDPAAASVASRPVGSQQLQSDPPRGPSPFTGDYRR